jgi:hypothetical protein
MKSSRTRVIAGLLLAAAALFPGFAVAAATDSTPVTSTVAEGPDEPGNIIW